MSSARLAAANFGLQLREDELHVAQDDLEDRKFERLQRDVSELKDDLKEILALLQGRDPGRRTSCGRRQHSPVLRHDSSIGSPSGVQSQRTDKLPALVPRPDNVTLPDSGRLDQAGIVPFPERDSSLRRESDTSRLSDSKASDEDSQYG